jgi:molecular chaperone DnaJ
MLKDYYAILGVSPKADRKEIQKAYRALVRKCHPDVCSEADSEHFTEVQEAYEILCDEQRRRQYDQYLARSQRRPLRHVFSSSLERTHRGVKEPISEVHNLVDEFFHHIFGESPLSSRRERMELVLDPEEARRGGTFHIELNIPTICPVCEDRILGQIFCTRCQGLGTIMAAKKVRVVVPPGITSGSELVVSMSEGGMEKRVVVTVCVEPG